MIIYNKILFYENLIKFFAQRDISKCNRRKLPQTAAKDEILEASESSYVKFISNFKPKFMGNPGYRRTQAFLDYQKRCEKFRYVCCSQTKFGTEINKYCEIIMKTCHVKKIKYYKLKPKWEEKIEEVINDENIVAYEDSI